MKEYNLTFTEVMDNIFKDKSWYQGENFANGYFIQSEDKIVHLRYFSDNTYGIQEAGPVMLSEGLLKQKFRKVLTQPDVMRKV